MGVNFWKKLWLHSPERIFLTIAIPFGLFFLVAMPPLQGWDEATHFQRVYHISTGHPFAHKISEHGWGGNLPVNVAQMDDAFLGDLINSGAPSRHGQVHTLAYLTYLKTNRPDTVPVTRDFTSVAVYSPVAYAVPAAGVATARLLHLPLLFYIYLGRAFELAVFLLLMYFAIKRAAIGKWVLITIGLLPTTMTLAVTMSSDAIIIGCASLVSAIFIDYLIRPRKITARNWALIAALMLILPLCKVPYLLFAGLFLFLPIVAFGSLKRYLIINAALIVGVLAVAAAWTMSVNQITNDIHVMQRQGVNVDPDAQVTFIKGHPLEYGAIVANNVITGQSNANYLLMASAMSWKAIGAPLPAVILSYMLIVASLLYTRRQLHDLKVPVKRLPRLLGWGALLIFIGIIVLINTSTYIAATIVGAQTVWGTSGRYYLPLLPLLILMILPFKQKQPLISTAGAKAMPRILVAGSAFVLLASAIVMTTTNYVPDIFTRMG